MHTAVNDAYAACVSWSCFCKPLERIVLWIIVFAHLWGGLAFRPRNGHTVAVAFSVLLTLSSALLEKHVEILRLSLKMMKNWRFSSLRVLWDLFRSFLGPEGLQRSLRETRWSTFNTWGILGRLPRGFGKHNVWFYVGKTAIFVKRQVGQHRPGPDSAGLLKLCSPQSIWFDLLNQGFY